MKVIKIISEHKKKATAGMVEAIVRLEDGRLVTRHIYAPKSATQPAPAATEQARSDTSKSERA